MAEVMENYATKSKANAALTTGIIGTSLAGLLTLGRGGLGNLFGGWGNGWGGWGGYGAPYGMPYGYGSWGNANPGSDSNVTNEDLYVERKECQDHLDMTRQFYEGKLGTQRELAASFVDLYQKGARAAFGLYKNNVDTSFGLYKHNVDTSFGLYKQNIDNSFALYKNQRDLKDELMARIEHVDKKVDVMAAIRPYQDALINAKIDTSALISNFNLAQRTCRMIQGQLVLPNSPVISGFGSYTPSFAIAQSTSGEAA